MKNVEKVIMFKVGNMFVEKSFTQQIILTSREQHAMKVNVDIYEQDELVNLLAKKLNAMSNHGVHATMFIKEVITEINFDEIEFKQVNGKVRVGKVNSNGA